MGHDHIRFVLMIAFFFSTCLIASFGSEMEIIRFSGTYTLTHSERVVQVTESITRSERIGKVTKVASLAPKKEKRRGSRRRRTTKEFEMRQKRSSRKEIEKTQTFIPTATEASRMTQGTTTDQQDLCWSRAHSRCPDSSIDSGQCCSRSDHESSQEFSATYSDSGSSSSFLVCQKVSLLHLNLSEWTIEGKGRSEVGEKTEKQQQQYRHESKNIPFDHDDGPYKPIFFVYPPQRPARLGRKRKVGNDDDGMDYYQPTFHLDVVSGCSSCEDTDTDSTSFSEYDPRIRGGFDSNQEDVSFYFGGSSGVGSKSSKDSRTGKGKVNGVANGSSYYDELCIALLLDYG